MFVAEDVSVEMLKDLYSEDYYSRAKSTDPSVPGYADYLGNSAERVLAFEDRVKKIENYCFNRDKLLDYGCAFGLGVQVAKDRGWKAYGIESSVTAAQKGRQEFGLDIREDDGCGSGFHARVFDVVMMWDVIEHLPNPVKSVRLMHKLLRPGGILALNTVCSSSLGARLVGAKWRHLVPAEHLHFFSRKSLKVLLQQNGFSIRNVSCNGTMMNGSGHGKLGYIQRQLEMLALHWRLKRIMTLFNLRDEQEVIAEAI